MLMCHLENEMGQAAGAIDDVLSAKAIVDQMVDQAVEHLQVASKYVNAISTTTQQQTKRKVASNATSSSSIMSSAIYILYIDQLLLVLK